VRALFVLAVACHPVPSDRPPSEILASLDRGPCNGNCPVYSVIIYRDGSIEYIGSQFVAVQGFARAHLSGRELDRLQALFERAHFAELGGSYERDHCIDSPHVSMSYREKSIQHCTGPGVPPALTELEAAFARLVRVKRWTGS